MPAPLIYSAYDTQSTALIDARVLGLFSAAGPLTYSAITGQFSITNAAADGTTKGAAAFTAADFNDNGAGLISLDYTNGQKATVAQPGFLTSTDWGIFNSKQAALTLPLSISNGGTNNAGPFTAGSVIFSNGTALTQDNAVFFWDDTTKSFCIGTVTQAAALTVAASVAGQAGCSIIGANRGAAAGTGGALTFQSGTGGSPNAATGGAGGAFSFTAGNGGSPTTSGAAGAGGAIAFTTGTGGNSLSTNGGVGGKFSVFTGGGGVSTRIIAALAGGQISLQCGNGGTNLGTGGGGLGGPFTLLSGQGGNSANSSAAGDGGSYSFASGGGGSNTSTGNAGNSGDMTFNPNPGGNTPAAAGTPGRGGNITFIPGNAGTSADNVLGNIGGSCIFKVGAGSAGSANGKLVFGAAAADVVNFVAGSGAAAPSTSVGVAIVNYYGSSATNFLGTPRAWLSIQAAGAPFLIPLY